MEFTKDEILKMAKQTSKTDDFAMKIALGVVTFFSVYLWNTVTTLNDSFTQEKTQNVFLKQKVDRYDILLSEPRFTKDDNDRVDVPTIKQLNENTVRINEIQDDLQKLSNNDMKLEYRLETLEKNKK